MFQEPGSLHINWSRISHFHPQMICLTPLGQSKEPSFVKYALSNLSMKIESKCYHSCGSFYPSRFYQLNSQAPVCSVVTGKFCILSYLSLSGITERLLIKVKTQWCTKTCSYLLKILWAELKWVSVLLSPFPPSFCFSFPILFFPWTLPPPPVYLHSAPAGSWVTFLEAALQVQLEWQPSRRWPKWECCGKKAFCFCFYFNAMWPCEFWKPESIVLWPLLPQLAPVQIA